MFGSHRTGVGSGGHRLGESAADLVDLAADDLAPEAFELGEDRGVVHLVADLDDQAAEERGVDLVADGFVEAAKPAARAVARLA